MKLCEHHKIENAWKAIAWDSESYSGGQVLSSPPAGGNVFKIARLQQPRFTARDKTSVQDFQGLSLLRILVVPRETLDACGYQKFHMRRKAWRF